MNDTYIVQAQVFNQDSNTHGALVRGMVLYIQNAKEYVGW